MIIIEFIHQLMLNDSPRNKAYKQAILDNKGTISGKVVLDVGAGTGILSIFCAQAGAAKVYAVEASKIYKIAQNVVKENQMEQIVTVINSTVEEAVLPEQVDVIVSEWMGFYLLHEGMLDSLIIAREKFLKFGGVMFPESVTLYSAPCSVPSMFEYWNSIEGVSLNSFGEKLRKDASNKPLTLATKLDDILAEPEVVTWIDLREVTQEDVVAIKMKQLTVTNKSGKYQGICLFFTCAFPSIDTEPIILSTEPGEPETHWKQTVVVLPIEIDVQENYPIAYELVLRKSLENGRRYDIQVEMLDPDCIEHPEYCKCHMTKCILIRAMLDKYENEKRSMTK